MLTTTGRLLRERTADVHLRLETDDATMLALYRTG